MKLQRGLLDWYYKYRSVCFDKKVLVIESDDWGSLRTETVAQRNALNLINSSVQKDPYIQLDGLADEDDLSALFEALASVKDRQENSPILTANVCTANPNFNKIQVDKYEKFHFEPFFETIEKKKHGKAILQLWKEGQTKGMFYPQLHGREHLHALSWLAELRKGNIDLLKAFELETWGIPYKATLQQRRKNLQAALDIYKLPNEVDFQIEWLKGSAKIFEDYFGYTSKSFIPPAYVWQSRINETLREMGVESIQGIKLQYQPKVKGYKRKLRFMGEKDCKHQLYYFPRNVFFEPSLLPNKDWHSETLSGIEKAFANKQPAIIGSHRINFIGKLNEENRTANLMLLKKILKDVVRKFPDVIFTSSDQLINYLSSQTHE